MSMTIFDYDKALLKAVKAKLPEGVNPVWFVMDTLSIGKEAAYRRLRSEVPLTLRESVLLADRLELSIDEVTGERSSRVRPLRLCLAEFENSEETDYQILQNYVDLLFRARHDPFSSLTISANTFPQQIYLHYPSLLKFFLFKWIYHNESPYVKSYSLVKITERMQRIFRDSVDNHMQFASTRFILDKQIGQYLAADLRYYTSVKLLTEEEMQTIRSDAHKMINYMEQLAITGKYPNGNRVEMYISDISFERSYYNIKINDDHVSVIETCILNGISSTDRISYQKMERWLNSRRRLSTQISQCGEAQRIAFFSQMRRQMDE